MKMIKSFQLVSLHCGPDTVWQTEGWKTKFNWHHFWKIPNGLSKISQPLPISCLQVSPLPENPWSQTQANISLDLSYRHWARSSQLRLWRQSKDSGEINRNFFFFTFVSVLLSLLLFFAIYVGLFLTLFTVCLFPLCLSVNMPNACRFLRNTKCHCRFLLCLFSKYIYKTILQKLKCLYCFPYPFFRVKVCTTFQTISSIHHQ